MELSGSYADYWNLDKQYNFNHGSFGATPQAILDRKQVLQKEFDRDRQAFFNKYVFARPDVCEDAVASFVGADPDNLVFVDNVSDGFNCVIKSLDLGKGDEVLITNQTYANFPPVLEELSRRQGFDIKSVKLPYPPQSDDEIVQAVIGSVSDRTKLAVIDHITSPTAVILPVKKIVEALQERGVDTFVDGAHAPGQIPVCLEEIGAAYYAANNHKWLCAPVSSGFLYVRKGRQDNLIPAVGSGGGGTDHLFKERFRWIGTRDVTARLCVPDTIDYMAGLHPEGWDGIYRRNHEMAVRARGLIMDKLEVCKTYPDSMFGSMFTVPLGELVFGAEMDDVYPHLRVAKYLQEKYGFFAYAFPLDGCYLLRVSCHLYNQEADYGLLAEGIHDLYCKYGKV